MMFFRQLNKASMSRVATAGWLFLILGPGAASAAEPVSITGLSLPVIVAADEKTADYAVRIHQQLERWGDNLVARLERGDTIRRADPILDGRYDLYIQKLRLTYAASVNSTELAAAIRRLADRHEQRRRCLEDMLHTGVDARRFSETSRAASLAAGNLFASR